MGLSRGTRAYLVIDCVLAEDEPPAGSDRPAVVRYGDGDARTLSVAVSQPGVYLVPAPAALALALCTPR